MATASHEHIPDLSASLSKSHHRAPISDLWGPSLSQKSRSVEASSDYAMEIARDTSRGPLMSSACTTSSHEGHEEPVSGAEPVPIAAKVGTALWSSPGHGSVASAVTAPVTASAPVSGSAPPSAVPAANGSSALPLRGIGPTNSPTYRGSHSAAPTPVGSVTPMSHFRSGIWGPRRSFSAYNGQAAFAPPASAGSVYGKTPWSVDLGGPAPTAATATTIPGVHSMAATPVPSVPSPVNGVAGANVPSSVPVQPGFYGMPHAVSSSMPPSSPMQKMTTPPRTSPSPPALAAAASQPRLYQARGGQGSPVTAGAPTALHPQHSPASMQQQSQHQQQQMQQQMHQQALRNHAHQAGNHHASGHDGLVNGHGRPAKKNGRPSTNTELYKTELCASYMSTGGNCPYGEKCQFAHGPQELKSVDRPPKWRSKPCQNWVKTGSCSYNERCCFRHDVPVGHGQP